MAEAPQEQERGQEHEPVLSDAEVIIVGVMFVTLDIVDWFEVGIPATDVASWFVQFGLFKKGVSGTYQVVVGILELIPGIDYLPIRTVSHIIATWADRHPDSKLHKLIKVAEIATAVKGKLAAKKIGSAAGSAAQGALQAEEKVASEAALAAEQAGAAGAAARGAPGEGVAEGGATKAARRDAGQPEGAGEAEQKPRSLEERRLDNAIRGRNIEDVMDDVFSPDQILAEIDTSKTTDNVRRFDPDRAMSPKPARQFARKKEQGKEPEKKDKEGEEEGKKKYLTPEQERLQTILEGKYVEEVGKKGLTAEGVMGPSPLSDIGETKGIIDDEEVDLREAA